MMMKYFINAVEVTKEIFDQRAKNHMTDDIAFVDECDDQETEMHLHSELEYAFNHLNLLIASGYQYDDLHIEMTDQIRHNGYDQSGFMLVLHFADGIIMLSYNRNLQKFYK